MHPYRMQKLISERGKDKVVNIRSRNSIQQTVTKLERSGLIEASSTEREGSYPQRTVYALTSAGRSELLDGLHRLLSTPAREFPLFPAALSFMSVTTVESAASMLRLRREELGRRVAEQSAAMKKAEEYLPPVFLIEEDYMLSIQKAEIAWIERTLRAMETGSLSWDTTELLGHGQHDRPGR
ncbi:PadR family transcriptional regulator [Mycolicibacterium sp. GF69]|nr:PadR family transcriptional regulator [Mycolicibacterium sp. GF69]